MAERRYALVGEPGKQVSIRIRKPVKDRRTGDYKCSVEWIRPEERELFELWGVDSMQALQVAMGAAGRLVDEYKEALHWAGGLEGYRGFPRTYPEFLPKPLLQKLERMIERELAANTRQILAERKRRERQMSRRAAEGARPEPVEGERVPRSRSARKPSPKPR
jgi:hypothetical protein